MACKTERVNQCASGNTFARAFTSGDLDRSFAFLDHKCKCGSCCRRLALWVEAPTPAPTDDWLMKAVADIIFGGFEACVGPKAEVDFKTGVVLDLVGDVVKVGVRPVEIVGTPPEIRFGALAACCGSGAARGCATRTTGQFLLTAAAQQVLIPIPPFAYAVTFVTTNPDGLFTQDSTFLQSGSGDSGDAYLASLTGDVVPDPWAIVNGARTLIVNVPIAGEGTQTFEAVFLIGL